jgi:protein-S-isoprenylcysteine O-methyltransferase Ste14
LISLLRNLGRVKGRSIGSGSVFRNWPAVAIFTLGFVVLGILLWRPLPFQWFENLERTMLLLGSLFYFPAIGMYLWGWVTLGREYGVSSSGGADIYSDHRLVTNGPYQLVRHPMYLSVILAAIGALLIFRTWAMAVFTPMSLIVIRRADHEEALLEMEFGSEWLNYRNDVPKWIPSWTRGR